MKEAYCWLRKSVIMKCSGQVLMAGLRNLLCLAGNT